MTFLPVSWKCCYSIQTRSCLIYNSPAIFFFLNHIALLIMHSVTDTQTKYIVYCIGGRVESILFSLQLYLRGTRLTFTSKMQTHSEIILFLTSSVFMRLCWLGISVGHWCGVLIKILSTNQFLVVTNNNVTAQVIVWCPIPLEYSMHFWLRQISSRCEGGIG